MSELSNDPPLDERGALEHAVEGFWGAALRRTRYAVAIALTACLFLYLGWGLVAPPANEGGLSILWWPGHSSVLAVVALAGILMVGTGICSLILHPDSPHAGIFCALLGMSAVAVRAGSAHMLIQDAQRSAGLYNDAMQRLSLECVYWAILFAVVEAFARLLHEWYFSNTRWISRLGADWTTPILEGRRGGIVGAHLGIALLISKKIGTISFPRPVATLMAVFLNGALGAFFLWLTLQSMNTGQVFFAFFISFLLSTLLTFLAFPNVPAISFFMAVPLVGAVGYLVAMGKMRGLPAYGGWVPGLPGFYIARALPIDFVTMGVPGAIMGYYMGFNWSLQTHEAESAAT